MTIHRLWILVMALLIALLIGPPAHAQPPMKSSLGTRPLPDVIGMSGESRTYHGVPLAKVKDTQWTHVSVCGKVTLAKHEADGDAHLRLEADGAFIVAEIVPYHRLPIPRVGQYVRVAGISRFDRQHGWWECHPVEAITVVGSCRT